jgi:hypothetical protein
MNKRILFLTLASTLLLSSCNPGNSSSNTASSTNTTSSPSTTSATSSSDTSSTSSSSTTSTTPVTPVDPEASYKITSQELADFLKNLANVTFTLKDANDSSGTGNSIKTFAGALSSQLSSDGDKQYSKVVDSREVTVHVLDNNGTPVFECENDVSYSPYSFTNDLQFNYPMLLTAFAGIPDMGDNAQTLYSPDDFVSKLNEYYAHFAYNTTLHAYEATMDGVTPGEGRYHTVVDFYCQNKQLSKLTMKGTSNGEAIDRSMTLSDIGTSVVNPTETGIEPYLKPYKVDFYDGTSTTPLFTGYAAYDSSCSAPAWLLPSKAAPDADHVYRFLDWDTELSGIKSDLSVKAEFALLDNTDIYTISGTTLTFLSLSSYVAEVAIPSSITTLDIQNSFYRNNTDVDVKPSYTLALGDNITTVTGIGSNYTNNIRFTVGSNNSAFTIVDGALYSKDMTKLYAYDRTQTATSFTVNDATTSIGNHAFAYAGKLQSITFDKKLTDFGVGVFQRSGITSLTLPDTNAVTQDGAFKDMPALTYCDVSSKTAIEASLFEGCHKLQEVKFANPLNHVWASAFKDCWALSKLTAFEYSLGDIAASAFENCYSLTSMDLSATRVSVIPDSAFKNCYSLSSITLPSGVTSIGAEAFLDTALKSFTIASGMTLGDQSFYHCADLLFTNENTTNYSLDGNSLYNADKSILYYLSRELSSYVAPASLLTISVNAASFNPKLVTLDLTAVTGELTIGPNAFTGEPLTSIVWPSSSSAIVHLDSNAFSHCESLTSLSLPSSVKDISHNCFQYCSKIASIDMKNSGITTLSLGCFSYMDALTSVTLPTSLTSIGPLAFSGDTALTSVIITGNVTSISYSSFEGCDALSALYLERGSVPSGYETGWNNDAAYYLYSDTAPTSQPLQILALRQ